MSYTLPIEFSQLEPQVEGMPEQVVEAFRYGLAWLLVENGRLTDIADDDDVAHFRAPDGSEFALPDPHLSSAHSQMIKTHLTWLLGL